MTCLWLIIRYDTIRDRATHSKIVIRLVYVKLAKSRALTTNRVRIGRPYPMDAIVVFFNNNCRRLRLLSGFGIFLGIILKKHENHSICRIGVLLPC